MLRVWVISAGRKRSALDNYWAKISGLSPGGVQLCGGEATTAVWHVVEHVQSVGIPCALRERWIDDALLCRRVVCCCCDFPPLPPSSAVECAASFVTAGALLGHPPPSLWCSDRRGFPNMMCLDESDGMLFKGRKGLAPGDVTGDAAVFEAGSLFN